MRQILFKYSNKLLVKPVHISILKLKLKMFQIKKIINNEINENLEINFEADDFKLHLDFVKSSIGS